MRIIKSTKTMQQTITRLRKKNKRIGFVPTMGDLHAGHLSLIKKSKKENDITVLSIFVNPKQFSPSEDFQKYPRNEKQDHFLAKKEKVDIIFYPSVEEMYSSSYLTYVKVEQLGQNLCGRSRPQHFRGVATVVAKLLNIVFPDYLYLGQKDAQQALIITKMIQDLNFQTKVKVLRTIREKDGLAMSSRNRYLNAKQRREAPILFQALQEAKQAIKMGETRPQYIRKMIQKILREATSSRLDYVECVAAETLQPLTKLEGKIMIALAVWFGSARLIDNIVINVQ